MNNAAEREEHIFEAALRFPAPEQRAAYIQGACANDEALRQRVETLLNAHERAGGFLDQPPAAASGKTLVVTTGMLAVAERPGDKIGRYKVLQQIGEGGCGVVYMAEQDEPVRRRVALKVIKLGMDTKSVNEPVLARPPTALYKLQKAFRRNKLLSPAGIAVAVALLLGIVGTTIGLLRAKEAK